MAHAKVFLHLGELIVLIIMDGLLTGVDMWNRGRPRSTGSVNLSSWRISQRLWLSSCGIPLHHLPELLLSLSHPLNHIHELIHADFHLGELCL